MVPRMGGTCKNECSFYAGDMPRVTDEHRAARREQILDAAWRCVSREGFHKTSMSDIIGESGLSAGAVYGYFKGKDELIMATARRTIDRAGSVFQPLLAQGAVPAPDEALAALLAAMLEVADQTDGAFFQVVLQVWAEAVRSPEIADTLAGSYQSLRDRFAEVVRRNQAAGRLPTDADPDEVARVMFGLLPGFLVQHAILRDVEPQEYVRGLGVLLAYTDGDTDTDAGVGARS